ncbi:MAG TPA: hypothetical protein VFB71_03160, partial [Ramlibacter sp.]|nr:hypothetical protein [Ramlibacter sp.]
PEADRGGNKDHGNADGCGNKTLGEHATHRPPAGADAPEEAGTPVPAGEPGSTAPAGGPGSTAPADP